MIYFYKRPKDEFVYPVEEKDTEFVPKSHIYLGCSSGDRYFEVLAKGEEALVDQRADLLQLSDELIDIDNKLKKATGAKRTALRAKQKKLTAKHKALEADINGLHDRAVAAELKVATKNKQPPPDLSVSYPNGSTPQWVNRMNLIKQNS